MTSLKASLALDRVRHSELAHLLMEYYNTAQQDGEDVTYGRSDGAWAVCLRYSGDTLVDVVAGPGLIQEDLRAIEARIHDELLAAQTPAIGRAILFAAVPVRGAMRVDDLLQILPVPETAPKAPYLMADHPFVVEFPFKASEAVWVRPFRYAAALADLTLLLNTLSFGGVKGIHGSSKHWTLVTGPSLEDWRSEFLQECYHIPSFIGSRSDFSGTAEYPTIPVLPDSEYYSQYGIRTDQDFGLPRCFPNLMRSFYAIEGEERTQFLRAAYWFAQHSRVWASSISLAYVCMISAIEALLPVPPTPNRCSACGLDRSPGITQRFAAFLEDLVPTMGSDAEKARKELYRVRSKLSHGGSLLRLDVERAAHLHPVTSAEYSLVSNARSLTQAALVTWLARCTRR